MRRIIITAIVIALCCAPLSARRAAAAGAVPTGASGWDISFPQCGKAYPGTPFGFGVVGVENGKPFTANPCLNSEWQWGRTGAYPPTLYINANFPQSGEAQAMTGPAGSCTSPQTPCAAYNWGWNNGVYAVTTARSASIESNVWWLDVEFCDCWATAYNDPDGQQLDATVMQGSIDYLRSQGLTAGIYSTTHQFTSIAGGYTPKVPVWLADYNTQDPAADCQPSNAFGGGYVWQVQTSPQATGDQFDPDYSCPSPGGYYLVGGDGGIFPFGAAQGYGSTGNLKLNKPIVGMATNLKGTGYWLVAADGGIFPFGPVGGWGSTGNIKLNKPIVAMAATHDGQGYWLVAADGGIFPFGDAQGWGSTGNIKLNQPIVGMTVTPSGKGYWLVAADGGIFPFGDAQGWGSTGDLKLNKPITGMAGPADGKGYWLVAADGGIFPFGDAPGYGSAGAQKLDGPVVSIAATPDGLGYWLATGGGTVLSYGDALTYGATTGKHLNAPMLGIGPVAVAPAS